MAIKNFAILILLINPIILYTMEEATDSEPKLNVSEFEEALSTKSTNHTPVNDSNMEIFEDVSKQFTELNADDPQQECTTEISYTPYDCQYKNLTLHDKVKDFFKGACKGLIGAVGLGFGLTIFYQAVKNLNALRNIWAGIGTCYAAAATYFAYTSNFYMFSPTCSNNYRYTKIGELDKKLGTSLNIFTTKEANAPKEETNKHLEKLSEKASTSANTKLKKLKEDKTHAAYFDAWDDYIDAQKESAHYDQQVANNTEHIWKFRQSWDQLNQKRKKLLDEMLIGEHRTWQERGYWTTFGATLGITALCTYRLTHR